MTDAIVAPPLDHLGRPVTGPKRPPTWRWERVANPVVAQLVERGAVIEAWSRGRLFAISSLEFAEFNGTMRWQWQVSVSENGQRCLNADVLARVLRDFDMVGAEEDNHQPGVARNFWRLCDADPRAPSQCECKGDETTVVEADGFAWQREGGQ